MPAGSEEREEATLVPARVRRRPWPTRASNGRKGFEQSWAFLAVAVVLAAAGGAAAGVYILRWQSPAETYNVGAPSAGSAPSGEAAGKVDGAEPAAEPTAPQPSKPEPQAARDGIAARHESAVAPAAAAKPDEASTKVERVNTPAHHQKTSPQAAEPAARLRDAEPEPRVARPARAATEARKASPEPRLTRADAGPRRAVASNPAPDTQPERPALISSPPASTKPRKVIKWP